MSNILKEFWQGSGLSNGDTLLLHGSMKRTLKSLAQMKINPNPEMIIDSFLDFLGKDGTLILPLFNFEFTSKSHFSIINTPSQMGVITEYARKNYDGTRTGHPVYSFYIIGAKVDYFRGVDNFSAYGENSPFKILRDLDGKIGVLDLEDQNSMTFYHHVEQCHEVNYRFHKEFTGTYENSLGQINYKTYEIFVRKLDEGIVTNVNRMGEILWNEGLYKGNRPNVGNGLRTIKANEIFQRTSLEIEKGNAINTLYSTLKKISLPENHET